MPRVQNLDVKRNSVDEATAQSMGHKRRMPTGEYIDYVLVYDPHKNVSVCACHGE